MACHFTDNVYTKTFTPREYQVELFDTALERNTIVSLDSSSAKTFIAIKLLQELSADVRAKPHHHSVFVMNDKNVGIMASHIKHLTDLSVMQFNDDDVNDDNDDDDNTDDCDKVTDYKVVVITLASWINVLNVGKLPLNNVNLLVIDDWLQGSEQIYNLFKEMMRHYFQIDTNRPRILGLSSSMLRDPWFCAENLEADYQRVENLLCCNIDTSSEIVSLLRYSSKPKEKVIVCDTLTADELNDTILNELRNLEEFLNDHRYDPSEIYDDDFSAEIRSIPDPLSKPKEIIGDMINIVSTLGSWAADQAAFTYLIFIEKLKVKGKYERHFLLLCTVGSCLVKIRAICDDTFKHITDYERIVQHSAPKIIRLIEVLKQFRPDVMDHVITATEQLDDNNSIMPNCDSSNNSSGGQAALDENKTVVATVVNEKPLFPQSGYKTHKTRSGRPPRRQFQPRPQQDDACCALIFVTNRFIAKVIYELVSTLSQTEKDYAYLNPLYIVDKVADPLKEPSDAEKEHKRQEDVLRKFRMHECNILVATSVLEEGIDIPKCNLVIRFDIPQSYYSYVQCKGRARASDAHYIMLVDTTNSETLIRQVSEYIEIEKILLRRCKNLEPTESEEIEADKYTNCMDSYKPRDETDAPFVNLKTAITLVNRYCAKLPSDTFTRLTPIWSIETKSDDVFRCLIRLPINSPVKQTVFGPDMPSKVLARRAAALKTCQLLHRYGELDDNLLPIGKESFHAREADWNSFPLEPADELLTKENTEPRPGTTKRRQYYYKKIAESLTECRPVSEKKTYFYHLKMLLTCPLPEEQNTRGRRIYPPEESAQGFGILTLKEIPKICPFPIFTRSGEVSVSLELCSAEVLLNKEQLEKISEFLHYTFTSVLRLQKYLMLFDPKSSENSYLIVPTLTNDGATEIDWEFLEIIYENRNVRPEIIPEKDRNNFNFEPDKYKDAVVMPWYRNQDQPQYFYVAEICSYLNPQSTFPGSEYATFEEYYSRKYDIQIQNIEQHLLDVDHTSARLNFLTPRYVNRKGVALPTSSEETKRAKRENLEQKQILVPELCAIHPFPASLWRKAVCLPCVLYRINALLLADQIRKKVAIDLGLGQVALDPEFEWAPLNFGWTLSDVLKKSKEKEMAKEAEHEATEKLAKEDVEIITESNALTIVEITDKSVDDDECSEDEDGDELSGKTKDWLEIGTWSNEMAGSESCPENQAMVRYGSPTSWFQTTYSGFDDFSESDEDYSVSEPDVSDSSHKSGGLRIEFTGDNIAEAIEDDSKFHTPKSNMLMITEGDTRESSVVNDFYSDENHIKFKAACVDNVAYVINNYVVKEDEPFQIVKRQQSVSNCEGDTTLALFERIDMSELDVEKKTTTRNETEVVCFKNHNGFSFDEQPNLEKHPGPSPSVILQALTMSNANDGINLERLETIGDSFLKYAITNYLYSTYETIHEGKLSHLRSKQVSNLNLYRLGRRKLLGESMIATKFDPHDNWLPPCYYVPKELEQALIDANYPASHWNRADMPTVKDMSKDEICQMVKERSELLEVLDDSDIEDIESFECNIENLENLPIFIPYNLITQHSIPDKSVADCVEALIGAYLIECGPRGALLFMAWLGIRVLPIDKFVEEQTRYGTLKCPDSPLLRNISDPETELDVLLDGYDAFETTIRYKFRDRSYLLQAFTHASYSPNMLTDCYQRLEFLGDAVLDYLITRHLYEDSRMHSPGALTDLRSALVNNTIFASLAVRHGFHKYFRHLSPGLHEVVERFVRIQEENGHQICEEYYLIGEDECDEVEDVEVPKALGDVFESVAGAIFLDSGMSLDAVWCVYYGMMQKEIEQFSNNVPKSPIRELLELEPETAKFGKPEKLADGRRVRVTVDVFHKGTFKGIGRNYRIAKCTAAKCALKNLKKRGLIVKRN